MASVLIVDDSPVDRRMAGGLLEGHDSYEIRFAENGRDALKSIESDPPDLVVTDLQMPDISGLELVTSIRLHHPRVPVILMTAHGSESLATEALESGASSYVPKNRLSEILQETVDEILALSRADRTYERLIECAVLNQFKFELDNDLELIEPLVDLVQQMAASMQVCDGSDRIQLGVALEQALRNAVLRGNLEIDGEVGERYRHRRFEPPYEARRVHVNIAISREEARFEVRDEGPGFDTSIVETESVGDGARRGLVLMKTFMDELSFNEAGNEVVMVKRRND